MKRRSEPHTFDERLNAEKARIEAELEKTFSGPQRDMLARKLRQIETCLHRQLGFVARTAATQVDVGLNSWPRYEQPARLCSSPRRSFGSSC